MIKTWRSGLAALAAISLGTPAFADDHKGLAWDIVEDLTTEIGPRLAGTEAEARAREWGVKRLKALGFANVRIETFPLAVWVRGLETGEVIAPFPQKLALTALGNSGATAATGLTGDVVGFASFADFAEAPADKIKGKIVYIGHAMRRTQDGSHYGPSGVVRRQGPNLAAQKGAAAILIRSIGTDNDRMPHTGGTRWDAGVSPIPAAALSNPDADNLERMLARAKTPVSIKIVMTPRFLGPQLSGNVIAEVPGTDPDAGIIAIGGHLDSWDLGTGAIDDGAGIAITTAAAKRILDGPKPRRTIRLIWWGAEEAGLFGGDAYYEAHKGERHALVAESDFGADRVWRVDFNLPPAAKPLADRITRALAPLGIAAGPDKANGGPDTGKLSAAGVSAIDLQQDGQLYFDLHHTPNDTLDKIDPAQLAQNVEAWSVMLNLAANAPEDLIGAPTP